MNILGLMSPQEYTQYETRLMEDYMEVKEVGSQEWTRLMSFQDEAHDQYFKAKMLAEENARLNIVVTNLKTVVSINQQENARFREVLEMVIDNSKMPHLHADYQTRLYCLAERAQQALETWVPEI